MIQTITIPLNTPLDLSSYDITAPNNAVAFKNKETVQFRNCLSNMRSVSGNGISTTAGAVISKKNGRVFYNDTDISLSGTCFLDDVKEIPYNIPGKYIASFVDANDHITVFSKGADKSYLTKYDEDGNDIKTLSSLGVYSAISRSQNYLEVFVSSPLHYMFYIKDGVTDAVLNTFEVTSENPLGKDITATLLNNIYVIGFDDIDQRKRITYILDSTSDTKIGEILYFGTVSPDGIITGEPVPMTIPASGTKYKSFSYLPVTANKNGVMKWDLGKVASSSLLNPEAELSDNNSNFPIPTMSATSGASKWKYAKHERVPYCLVSKLIVDNTGKIDVVEPDYQLKTNGNPRFLTPYPYDLGAIWNVENIKETTNIFPTRYLFTNQTENRNKYWGYGVGWSKYLSFEYQLHIGTGLIDILTSPLKVVSGNVVDIVDPIGKQTEMASAPSDYFRNDTVDKWLNIASKDIIRVHKFPNDNSIRRNQEWVQFSHTIAGTNVEAWLFSIPFTSEVSNMLNEPLLTSQIFNGLTVSYGIESTLLSTPSDENDRQLWLCKLKNKYVFIDGYSVYQIVIEENIENAPLKVSKVADYCYKFNILNSKNFLKESSNGAFDFIQGFSRYNMDTVWNIESLELDIPKDGTETNDIFFFASGFNQELNEKDPLSTFLYPAIQLKFFLNADTGGDRLYFDNVVMKLRNPLLLVQPNKYFVDDEYYVDVYYTHTLSSTEISYKYTAYADSQNTKFFDSNKDGFIWATAATEIFFPVGMGSIVESENFITPTIKLSNDYSVRLYNKNNQTFIIFNTLNKIYKGKAIFTIYGGNYIYDGQGIYYVGSANDYSLSQFVCYALGLKFLANSGTEAYFYSPWEKRMFLFTGSNTLQAADSFSALGDVVDSLFSSNEQTLYILFNQLDSEDNLLVMRTQTDQGALAVDNKYHLESTEKGAALVTNDTDISKASFNILSPYIGTPLPFRCETEYIGDTSVVYRFPVVDIMLLGLKKNITFDVKFNVLNGINTIEEKRHIELKEKDWKADTYRYSFNPVNITGNSFKVTVESDDDIYISYIGVGVEDVSTTPGAPISK